MVCNKQPTDPPLSPSYSSHLSYSSHRGCGGIPRSLSVLLLGGHAEVIPVKLALRPRHPAPKQPAPRRHSAKCRSPPSIPPHAFKTSRSALKPVPAETHIRPLFINSGLDSEEQTDTLPADAVTIPATARGTFHLPPAAIPSGVRGPLRCPFCPSTATPKLGLVNLSHFHINTTHCATIRPEAHYFVVLARILLYDLWVEMLHPKDNLKHIIHRLGRVKMRTNQYWDKRLRPCKDSMMAF